MKSAGIAAVILAAGASRRLGRPKQLMEHQGETLIARTVRIAREAGLEPVVVVVGAEREAVQSAAGANVFCAENDDWQDGIASSMRTGLKAVEEIAPDTAAVVMMVCDQPRLTAEHLLRLVDGFAAGTLVCSTYGGVRGVPAVFPRAMFPELMKLSGDVGAKKLLGHGGRSVVEVPFDGGEVDIDTPEDLGRLD